MSLAQPKDREIVPLDSLCEKIRGVSYKREEASSTPKEGYLPILRANNVDSDKLRFDELVWVPSSRVKDSQKIKKGDIVVVMSSGSKSVVGKTAQALEDWNGGFGAFCGVLRPNKNAHQRYLGMFLRTKEYRSRISELAAGSNINNLKNEHLANIEVPLVPFEEQRRIVAKLEKLLEKVDACQKRLAKIPILLKRFRQSILSAACSGRLTADWRERNPSLSVNDLLPQKVMTNEKSMDLPESWHQSTVGECFLDIRNGITNTQNAEGKGLAVSRIETIQNKRFDMDRIQHIESLSTDAIDKFRYQIGDIAFSHINSLEHVGKTALYEGQPKVFIHGMNLLRLRLGHGWIEPHFAHLFMQTQFFREEVRKRVGHAVNQVSINQKNLAEVPFVVPAILEQNKIVKRVESFFILADQIETRYKKAQAHVNKLTQSILAKAFRGELARQEIPQKM